MIRDLYLLWRKSTTPPLSPVDGVAHEKIVYGSSEWKLVKYFVSLSGVGLIFRWRNMSFSGEQSCPASVAM